MLTIAEQTAEAESTSPPRAARLADDSSTETPATASRSTLRRALRIEWLGQTVASLCWIVSVFVYGISSAGDWLQLAAASAWLVANVAALVAAETD